MKMKVLFVVLLLASFLSCKQDPSPTVLTYEFEDVSAYTHSNECLIRCKNDEVDNVHVFARVMLWGELEPYRVFSFPMERIQDQLRCHVTGLRSQFKYCYSFEVYTQEDNYYVPEYYDFTTTSGSNDDSSVTVADVVILQVDETTAMASCSVTDLLVEERGVCWSTITNPTIADNHKNGGTGPGDYTVEMKGLLPNTKYYVRGYGIKGSDVIYGNQKSFTTISAESNVPVGALKGLFSVSDTQQVYFSQGNLQYKASTGTWRFATHQYDIIGDGNAHISSTYNDWIDLFGWATSGYEHGATCYQPWNTSLNNGSYCAYGSVNANLFDQTGQADWGYNAISNGGDTINAWRTPTKEEWSYVLNKRNTFSGIRFAKAQVNNVNGVILLPDNWNSNYYTLNSTNAGGASYTRNIISLSVWENKLENHDAVFLPATGSRTITNVQGLNTQGSYWSASNSYYGAHYVFFNDSYLNLNQGGREYGSSVRLVREP